MTDKESSSDDLNSLAKKFKIKEDVDFIQKHYKKGKLYNLEAVRLWQQGKDIWNGWVEKNPKCDVDFSKVDFNPLRRHTENEIINFSGFNFPNGNVDFQEASFGEGKVDFRNAGFGEGLVSFMEATFGNGNVDFRNADFGEGDVNFSSASFGEGKVNFFDTSFGAGEIDFFATRFGVGDVYFNKASFGMGNVDFKNASFGEGNVSFFHASFGEGDVNFSSASFGKGNVTVEAAQSKGNLIFRGLKDTGETHLFIISGASIDGLLSLSGNTFNCVPDLTETSIKHDVELQTLRVHLKRKDLGWKGLWAKKAVDSGDVKRLRKLKQIAEDNKHHEAALRFHADEMRAKRWQEKGIQSISSSILDILYSATSNYGQSIARPIITLLILWEIFLVGYKSLAFKCCVTWHDSWSLVTFMASNSLPFTPSSKAISEDAIAMYFGEYNFYLHSMMAVQGLLSYACLFLIGLGIRNRFRI